MKKVQWICIFMLLVFENVSAFELIAHRGIHQTFHRENLDNNTCTATRIHDTGHPYLENTLDSIAESFLQGATMVEIDIRPTKESTESGHLVVFHDHMLECRTNARCDNGCKCNDKGICMTHDQPLSYLKTLQIGYGYTYDAGKSFPFRDGAYGEIPLFEDVLQLLTKTSFQNKKIMVNLKDTFDRTVDYFIRIVSTFPLSLRQRLHFQYRGYRDNDLQRLGVVNFAGKNLKACFKNYILYGWIGIFPEACRNKTLIVPVQENLGRWFGGTFEEINVVDLFSGWPDEFIQRAKAHNSRVILAQVNSVEAYRRYAGLSFDGMMTDRIALIAPLVYEQP